MSTSVTGRLRVCISDRHVEDVAMETADELIANGLPLVVVDAVGMKSSRMRQLDAGGTGLEVLRATTAEELVEIISSRLEAALERSHSSRVLIAGLLHNLYDPRMQTREAARALGQLKCGLETLAHAGIDVVLCESQTNGLGTRSHFLRSLCISASRVLSEKNSEYRIQNTEWEWPRTN